MNGLAKPLVICNDTPSSIEKMKNIAMRLSLKSVKALNPRASIIPFLFAEASTGHAGSVMA